MLMELAIVSLSLTQSVALEHSVIANLRAYDEPFLEDMTLRAYVLEPLFTLNPVETERLLYRVSVTNEGGAWAGMSELDESVSPPKYSGAHAPSDYTSDGAMELYRSVIRRVLLEPGFHAEFEGTHRYEVESDGVVRAPPGSDERKVLRPYVYVYENHEKNVLKNRSLFPSMLTSGRVYSLLIDSITSATVGDHGLIHCEAQGRDLNGNPSLWEITVDPEASYLVRRARCMRADNGSVRLEMENEGVKWFEHGALPEFGYYYRQGRRSSSITYEVTFESYTPEPDPEVMQEAKKLRGDYPVGTIVKDFRIPTKDSYQVGRAEAELQRGAQRELKLTIAADLGILVPQDEPAPTRTAEPDELPSFVPVPETPPDRRLSWWWYAAAAVALTLMGGLYVVKRK